MNSAITSGVEITVETFYQPEYSNPLLQEFMFAYRIVIENHNAFTIQLISRHWHIFDSNGEYRQVEGEGVVGQQPILKNGQKYQYVSGCQLKSEMGTMHGTFEMTNLSNHQNFTVKIPRFQLVSPLKYN